MIKIAKYCFENLYCLEVNTVLLVTKIEMTFAEINP